MTWAGRGVVVAGTTSLARAVTLAAASRGAQVVVSMPPLDEETPDRVHSVAADPSQEADVEHLFGVATARLPRIDMVVSVLPELPARPLVDLALSEWEEGVSRALRAAFFVSRLAVEEFLAHGAQGRLVHVIRSAERGRPGQARAAACVESLLSLAKSTAKEYGPRGICCNAVVASSAAESTVVEAVLFLASPEASYINGEALRVGSHR